MSKFNKVSKNTTKATSYEGGTVYTKSVCDEWSNILFSWMFGDGAYESSQNISDRYIELTEEMLKIEGPEFVAKAAHFSRNVLGLRSISELTAAILNRHTFEGKREFFAKYFKRPDGVGEVFAAIDSLGDKRSHALIRGCRDYLESLNEYQIGKYTMQSHTYNMHDIVNLTHAYSPAIDSYQKGTLSAPDTWEVSISGASPDNKEREWKRLVEEGKLGYLALLRNLRNIVACGFATDTWCETFLCKQIESEAAIKKSLVFPYQIYVAWKNSRAYTPIVVELALSKAFAIATKNMPSLEGDSAIVLDVSGSMETSINKKSDMSILETCAVYAAAIYVKNPDCRVIKFGTQAKVVEDLGQYKNVFKLIDKIAQNDGVGHGTNINSVFPLLDKHFSRIFVFSDMQIMEEGVWDLFYSRQTTAKSAWDLYRTYEETYGKSKLYSFDLGQYHTHLMPQGNAQYITSLTDMVFKAIELSETSNHSLIDVVKQYRY